jgi:hypothetical protein
LRQRPGFQSDPLEAVGGVPQNLQKGFGLARYLHFLHDPARVIHNADAGLLDRYVQSTKMVHAALLLLMLEAVTTDLVFTISLKRSTQNLQLSTTWAGRLHHLFGLKRTSRRGASTSVFAPELTAVRRFMRNMVGLSDFGNSLRSSWPSRWPNVLLPFVPPELDLNKANEHERRVLAEA